MNIARIVRAAAMAGSLAAGALGTTANAAPMPAPATEIGVSASDVTPVRHYGSYYTDHYGTHYQPYYAPYVYAPPPPRPRYYAPYPHGYYDGYHYRHRPHGGVYVRTPGLRLGIGW